MATPKSYKGLLNELKKHPQHIQDYFSDLPKLLTDFLGYEVSIAYAFFRLEHAYNRALYGGARKLHNIDKTILSQVMAKQHLTRDGFLGLFTNVFDYEIPDTLRVKIRFSEKIRDQIIHGKVATDADSRKCLSDILEFVSELDDLIYTKSKFSPFRDMRGMTGPNDSLDGKTSRWVMRGMGFAVG